MESWAGAAVLAVCAPVLRAAADGTPARRYLTVVARKDGLSHEDFAAQWLAQGSAAKALPNFFGGLVMSEVIGEKLPANLDASIPSAPVDGVLEVWSPSDAARKKTLSAAKDWAAATDALASKATTFVTRQHVFIPPPRGTIKQFALLVRKDGLTHAEFVDHWLTIHGPMALTVPGLKGFVLSEIVGTIPGDEAVYPGIDGIAEVWWEASTDGRGQMNFSDQMKTWGADGSTFISRNKSRTPVLQEHVFVAPVV